MRHMGFSVFWAATLLTALAPSGYSQNAEPYPVRKDRPPPVGLTPPAAAYTGITPGAFSTTSGPRKEMAPIGLTPPAAAYPYTAPSAFNTNFWQKGADQYGLGQVVPVFLAPPIYWPSLPVNSAPINSVKPPAVLSDPKAQALTDQQGVMADQLEQLSAEVNRVKSINAGINGQPAPPPSSGRAAANPEPPPRGAPLILILQNGQRLKLQSYAVINQTVWDFSEQPARSIPFSNVNVPASQSATEAAGGEFPPLNPSH
jgi:hypothetical protein